MGIAITALWREHLNNYHDEERGRMNLIERGRMRTSMTLNNSDYGLTGLFDCKNIIRWNRVGRVHSPNVPLPISSLTLNTMDRSLTLGALNL